MGEGFSALYQSLKRKMHFQTGMRTLIRFAGLMSPVRVLNLINLYLSYQVSRFLKRPIHSGYPFAISVEPTTRCNLSCPECVTGSGVLKRPGGDLSMELYSQIIEEVYPHTFWINFYLQGEAMLNPALPEMISLASRKRIFSLLSTNGHFLDKTSARKLIESGLCRIIISVDGSDEESYLKYRRNGNFSKLMEGIKILTEEKKKAKSLFPEVIIQYLMFAENEGSWGGMNKLKQELGADRLWKKSAQLREPENPVMHLPSNQKNRRYKKGPVGLWEHRLRKRNRCFRSWSSLVITWDGRVLPCCYDKNADWELGNLPGTTVRNIWKGLALKHFRSKILRHKKEIPICCNCNE